MIGLDYLALAALILLLLPVVVLPWEGRKVPDALYVLIAVSGLVMVGVERGLGALPWAAATGIGSFLLIATVVTVNRKFLNLQILTSGHIKLLAAGSIWLGFTGTLAMLCIAFAALFGVAAIQKLNAVTRRPDFAAIAALAILCVSVQQTLPETARVTDQQGD